MRQDLNLEPAALETAALAVELHTHDRDHARTRTWNLSRFRGALCPLSYEVRTADRSRLAGSVGGLLLPQKEVGAGMAGCPLCIPEPGMSRF